MLKDLKLIVYDFDGVMTDNKVILDENGTESVIVNRGDGLGISEIKKLNIEQLIISTETNLVVSSRAKKLKIPCLQGIENKKKSLLDYCKKNNFDLKNVAFVGNDINDKEVMKVVGLPICPKDSHENILSFSKIILNSSGGQGVVREIFDMLIKEIRE
jgi:YrbI family 3-deoxy-D-manno-octulosonate 8-phosphate phosphatase